MVPRLSKPPETIVFNESDNQSIEGCTTQLLSLEFTSHYKGCLKCWFWRIFQICKIKYILPILHIFLKMLKQSLLNLLRLQYQRYLCSQRIITWRWFNHIQRIGYHGSVNLAYFLNNRMPNSSFHIFLIGLSQT